MLVALGWMLLIGLPIPSPTHSPVTVVHGLAATPRTPAGRVTVWTDRDEPYRRGQAARVYLSADEDAHVAVFRVDTDGRIRVLFPHEPWGETFVRGGRTLEVSGLRGGRSFMVDDDPGMGYLLAVASPDRFEFDDITRGDWWDYRLIDGGRVRGDPYVLLRDLADRITRGGDYEYDIAPYYVDRHYDYPRFVCYDCHAYASYDDWDPYERACRRFRLEIYDDPSRYPYRQGGGRNVVAPGRGVPRYVFRDADPEREYVTRVPRPRAEARGESVEPARGAGDVGGRGAVPAPGLHSLGRRSVDRREPGLDPVPPGIEERRRQGEDRRGGDSGKVRGGLKPAEDDRRLTPRQRPGQAPQSTGEPELRRRRP
ncbi:MAG TPA: DUF4384 domain-containing protein [Gemmatimonadales bacterium]|nr:DUF4384 domain-containing protein [Gemmatimonadales bacterium]